MLNPLLSSSDVSALPPVTAQSRSLQTTFDRVAVSTRPSVEPDRAELSARALQFAEAAELRGERVHSIREQIRSGTYDTAERLEAAIDKLIAAALGVA